jgi:hypothetical protein
VRDDFVVVGCVRVWGRQGRLKCTGQVIRCRMQAGGWMRRKAGGQVCFCKAIAREALLGSLYMLRLLFRAGLLSVQQPIRLRAMIHHVHHCCPLLVSSQQQCFHCPANPNRMTVRSRISTGLASERVMGMVKLAMLTGHKRAVPSVAQRCRH